MKIRSALGASDPHYRLPLCARHMPPPFQTHGFASVLYRASYCLLVVFTFVVIALNTRKEEEWWVGRPLAWVGHILKWVGQLPELVGHGLPGLIDGTATEHNLHVAIGSVVDSRWLSYLCLRCIDCGAWFAHNKHAHLYSHTHTHTCNAYTVLHTRYSWWLVLSSVNAIKYLPRPRAYNELYMARYVKF